VFEITGDTVIGRSARADIQIEGDLVSRQHGRFSFHEGTWHFEDLGSRNGSLLNNERVTSSEVRSGDVVMIGYGKILFEELVHTGSSIFSVSIIESETDLAGATVADDPDDQATGATVALSYKDLVLVNQRMNRIARISQKLATILDRDELLGEVIDTLFELFEQIDRAAVVLRDEMNTFHVVATRQKGASTATMSVMKISTSLIQFVQREGKAVLSADTAHDDRFSGRESIVGSAGGRSIMCAPLLAKDDFLGVIYLDTESLTKPFRHNDLNLLQGIAGPMAIFLKNAELVSRIETETTMRTSLSRYLSPDIVHEISSGGLPDLGGSQMTGTVMFSDIVGFTAMSEQMKPVEVVERLNRYFTSMLEAIFGWEGTVDKFGGDAILAVWGAPVPNEEHAPMATAAALEMQARLFELNCALEEAGETMIGMAVGLNSGRFVAGNIGGQDRIEWTVIGDAVNLAQRVESEGFPQCCLVSETTYADFDGQAGCYSFPPVHVKNRNEPVTIYSIRTLRNSRGVVAAIPVMLAWKDEEARGIIYKVHTKGKTRLSVKVAGAPPVGVEVKVKCDLPEHPGLITATGNVAGSAPMLLSKTGRSVDVDVTDAHEELTRLFGSDGAAEASLPLHEIER
jgi:adenylate cyclase